MANNSETTHVEDLAKAMNSYLARPSKLHITNPLYPYQKAARWVYCSIDLFCSIRNALYSAIETTIPNNFEVQDYNAFEEMNKLLPLLDEVLARFSEKPEQITALTNLMVKWADGSRNEDTATLKKHALAFIPLDPHIMTVSPPIPETDKSLRGFNHVMIARLLCPRDDIDIFDENPSGYMQGVKDGTISIRAGTCFPNFLYDQLVPLYSGNDSEGSEGEDSVDKGLFRGHFLLRVLRCIFSGPSSAISKIRKAAKSSKAEIHNMTSVTPHILAYTCVLARQTLASTEHWVTVDGSYKYHTLYKLVLKVLNDAGDEWVQDLFVFLNNEVPGLNRKGRKRTMNEVEDNSDEEHEFLDRIFEARRQ